MIPTLISAFCTSVSQVGKATMALGRKVAPHIQRQGTRAITHFTGQKESEASSSVSLLYYHWEKNLYLITDTTELFSMD